MLKLLINIKYGFPFEQTERIFELAPADAIVGTWLNVLEIENYHQLKASQLLT